jgi:hypothetical protein
MHWVDLPLPPPDKMIEEDILSQISPGEQAPLVPRDDEAMSVLRPSTSRRTRVH